MSQELKIQRLIKQLSQTDVAKHLGISYTSYAEKENGKRDFTQTEINKLLDLFEKNYEELFRK